MLERKTYLCIYIYIIYNMQKTFGLIILFLGLACHLTAKLPEKKIILSHLTSVNDRFMRLNPSAGDPIHINQKTRPSNIWTRSVYMEGLLALNEVVPESRYTDYVMDWGKANAWNFNGGTHTRNADNQCCAQSYIDMARLTGNFQILGHTERMLNNVVNSTQRNDWWWIDALQMAMPVYAKMGNVKKDVRYFRTMKELYCHTRNCTGDIGLFNPAEGLWWRDADFLPPYKEPNGENCYWSRGNGWVMAALVRTIEEINRGKETFKEQDLKELMEIQELLTNDLITMSLSIRALQRPDGFWNCSLTDEFHYGGRETSGTALFIYGMAWGIRNGLLSPEAFLPTITKAWNGIINDALHPDGFLGYQQSTGKEPKDGQPLGYDKQPDSEDFGIGCFLLAGSEILKLIK